jgi:hypothetical protein
LKEPENLKVVKFSFGYGKEKEMRFGIIDPRTTRYEFVETESLDEAKKLAGLDPDKVDHGVIWRDFRVGGISIVVYEFALYLPAERARYFAIGQSLYVGQAVLYGFDVAGETIDLSELPPVFFLRDAAEVERAIATGQITRPIVALNDDVIWRWPEPCWDAEIAERVMKEYVE